jgi:type IV fimbrial biogenesis protein FimT
MKTPDHRSFPGADGFTILELMITVSIAAILLVIGVSAFQNYGAQQRMNSAISALHSDLIFARSSAIHLDVQVIACPGNLTEGCSGATDWSNGWIIFSDINTDRRRQQIEPLLRHAQGAEQMAIRGSAGRTTLRFYPNGSAPGSNSSILLCDRRGPEFARKLILSNLGRVRRETATDAAWDDCPGTGS